MADVWTRLINAFRDKERNWRQTVYIYAVDAHDQVRKPYLEKVEGDFGSDSELLEYLQDFYGAGSYKILIRDGSEMVFSGSVRVGARGYR